MFGLIKALGVVKAALAIGVLTAATTFTATQVVLPAASANGQDHATAGPANAVDAPAAVVPDISTGKDVQALVDRLSANQQRVLTNLEEVLANLKANPNVNEHATAAIQAVLDQLAPGSGHGLDRATQAVQGQNPNQPAGPGLAGPSLPDQSQASPPPAADHSTNTDHPTATDHPSRP